MDEQLSGVEAQDDPVAGDQQDYEEEDILGLGETTGDDEDGSVAGDQQDGDEGFEDESTERAFAARLKQKEQKLTEEIEGRLRQEYEAKYRPQQQPQPQQQQYYPPQAQPPPLPRQQLEELADQLGVTAETANAMYHQQWLINQQNEAIRRQDEYLRRMSDNSARNDMLKSIERRRKDNPHLPEPDEGRLAKIRQDHLSRYGHALPWEEAYEKMVAQEAISGNLARTAQQRVINNITSRGTKTVQAGKSGRATKPSIDDLSGDEFERLIADAKAGKFKRS